VHLSLYPLQLGITGIAPALDFIDPKKGMEASVSYAIKTYMPGYAWLSVLVSVAILAGFSSVMLVMLLGQSRVFYSMSKDGLLPRLFAELHPKFRTPYKCNWVLYVFVGCLAGSARRHHRQHDQPRHTLRLCACVHRRLGDAQDHPRIRGRSAHPLCRWCPFSASSSAWQ